MFGLFLDKFDRMPTRSENKLIVGYANKQFTELNDRIIMISTPDKFKELSEYAEAMSENEPQN